MSTTGRPRSNKPVGEFDLDAHGGPASLRWHSPPQIAHRAASVRASSSTVASPRWGQRRSSRLEPLWSNAQCVVGRSTKVRVRGRRFDSRIPLRQMPRSGRVLAALGHNSWCEISSPLRGLECWRPLRDSRPIARAISSRGTRVIRGPRATRWSSPDRSAHTAPAPACSSRVRSHAPRALRRPAATDPSRRRVLSASERESPPAARAGRQGTARSPPSRRSASRAAVPC